MTNLDYLEVCLCNKWFFGKQIGLEGDTEWYIEAWSKEKDDWIEARGRLLSSVVKSVQQQIIKEIKILETKND